MLLGIAALGCTATAVPADKAVVNDVAVPAALDSGYRITKVDGKLVERARSQFVSVVPFVLLDEGEHTLSLQAASGKSLPDTAVTATFEVGKRYRLKKDGDVVSVVADKK